MKRRDWLLLAVNEAKNGLTPVQLQKALFLLGKERPLLIGADFYDFEPFNYGPFDARVYWDAEELAHSGLLVISQSHEQPVRRHQITPDGQAQTKEIAKGADKEALEYLQRVVRWVERQSFRALVEAIYRKYPEQRENSVFVS